MLVTDARWRPRAGRCSEGRLGGGRRVQRRRRAHRGRVRRRQVQVLAADGSGRAQTLTGTMRPVNGVDISADGRRVVERRPGRERPVVGHGRGGTARVLLGAATARRTMSRSAPTAAAPRRRRRPPRQDLERARAARERRGQRPGAAAHRGGVERRRASVRRGRPRRRDARLERATAATPVAELRGQRSRVLDVGFGATSDRVVSAGFDGTVRLWDAGRTRSWTVPGVPNNIEFNHDGTLIATSSEDGTVRVWDPATGRLETACPVTSGTRRRGSPRPPTRWSSPTTGGATCASGRSRRTPPRSRCSSRGDRHELGQLRRRPTIASSTSTSTPRSPCATWRPATR